MYKTTHLGKYSKYCTSENQKLQINGDNVRVFTWAKNSDNENKFENDAANKVSPSNRYPKNEFESFASKHLTGTQQHLQAVETTTAASQRRRDEP